MSVRVVMMETKEAEIALDRATMAALRDAVGPAAFDELIEDAIFEITERIARIEELIDSENLAAMARLAHDLIAVAGQIGMTGVSQIAINLETCCADEATVSAKAIAHRLVRVGGASLVAAAELSVDLAASDNGRQVV